MSFSVGSGPMPQPDSAAAPPPATPSTWRNRLRSIPSLISSRPLVVTHRAVAADIARDVTADAPPHLQRGHLADLRHPIDLAVTVGARLRPRPEHLDMPHVREVDEPGQRVDPDPLGRFPVRPGGTHLPDFGLMRWSRSGNDLMTAEAGAQRRDPRLGRYRHRIVAVHARDLVLAGVDVVSEEDRLTGALQSRGVGNDGSLVARGARSGRGSLGGDSSAGHGDHQEYSTRGPAPYGRRQGGGLDL